MAKRSNKPFEDLDITKQELKDIGEAFKKKEFVELFAEYAREVNDPENKKIYEQEIKELEKERGHDVTFIHPKPGYVIKTSVDGCQKAFVNICHDENIGKPTAGRSEQNGTAGLTWSVPYSHVKGRVDFDNKRNYCMFYDVVFHPDSIYLAKKNAQFRKLIEDTALTAVEDINEVKLDRNNLKYPKSLYKGPPQSSVIRKKIDNNKNEDIPFPIPNYPYSDAQEKPKVSEPRQNENTYTIPVYKIKQRKDVDIQDYTYDIDAKIHSSIPSELVIEVELPLIKRAADVDLEIEGKSLSLLSEKTAKYKLNINLPYSVDENNGSAKFDVDEKKLIITLPVIKRKFVITDFVKEDSGIESDRNKSSSEEDISKDIEIISSTEALSMDDSIEIITPKEILSIDFEDILKPDRLYNFPRYNIIKSNSVVELDFDVKNVEPSSLQYRFIDDGLHLTYASIGSGCFPTYYAFFIKFSKLEADWVKLKAEVYENNFLVRLECDEKVDISNYSIGLDPRRLRENEPIENEVNFKESIIEEKTEESPFHSKDDSLKTETKKKKLSKSRTLSESTLDGEVLATRSILKKSRSYSESHTDDWSSFDSEDNSVSKKTVRFNDVISRQLFRPNSSILGQKKKSEKKSRNRKKAMERKRSESESEFSEYSEVSEVSDFSSSDITDASDASSDDNLPPAPFIESAKQHRRRGSKNRRKNAATAKQNFILNDD